MRESQLCFLPFRLPNRKLPITRLLHSNPTWASFPITVENPLWWRTYRVLSKVLARGKVWDCVSCVISSVIHYCCLWFRQTATTFVKNMKSCWTNCVPSILKCWTSNVCWLSPRVICSIRSWWTRLNLHCRKAFHMYSYLLFPVWVSRCWKTSFGKNWTRKAIK